MSIFWMPDEEDRPRGGAWTYRPVAEETIKWIDPRAVERLRGMLRALAVRVGTASRDLSTGRPPYRLPRPAIRSRRA
jgi:hypothetical protein